MSKFQPPPPPKTLLYPQKQNNNEDENYKLKVSKIFRTIDEGNIQEILAVLRTEKIGSNFTDSEGNTIIHHILLNKEISNSEAYNLISQLALKGIACDVKNNDGIVPLHLASKNGNSKVCDLLLKKHVDLNQTDNNGYSSLFYALTPDTVVCDEIEVNNYKLPVSEDVNELDELFKKYSNNAIIQRIYDHVFDVTEKYFENLKISMPVHDIYKTKEELKMALTSLKEDDFSNYLNQEDSLKKDYDKFFEDKIEKKK